MAQNVKTEYSEFVFHLRSPTQITGTVLHSAPVMFKWSGNYIIEKEDDQWAWSPFKHELNHKWSEPNLWNQRILHEKKEKLNFTF